MVLVFGLLQVKTIFLPTEKPMTLEACAPLIATLPLEVSFFIFIIFDLISDDQSSMFH
jgi:ATP citrate (pro-S)-lyase